MGLVGSVIIHFKEMQIITLHNGHVGNKTHQDVLENNQHRSVVMKWSYCYLPKVDYFPITTQP